MSNAANIRPPTQNVGSPWETFRFLGDVQVVSRIRPTHVERLRSARRAGQAEVREELLHGVQIRRPQPYPGQVS
ncbi:MAG: hypothetical protein ACREKJ_17820, partial [Candidatus Rokuibacteriota bacterium]